LQFIKKHRQQNANNIPAPPQNVAITLRLQQAVWQIRNKAHYFDEYRELIEFKAK